MTVWSWPDSRVVRVIDGDTFLAALDFVGEPVDAGFHATITPSAHFVQRLRLNRINTMPKTSILGRAATDRTSLWLSAGLFDVQTVGPYKYGDEWMAEVTRDGENLSDLLMAEGHAVLWSGRGRRPDGAAT